MECTFTLSCKSLCVITCSLQLPRRKKDTSGSKICVDVPQSSAPALRVITGSCGRCVSSHLFLLGDLIFYSVTEQCPFAAFTWVWVKGDKSGCLEKKGVIFPSHHASLLHKALPLPSERVFQNPFYYLSLEVTT